jgi:hypothetical protein
MIPPAFIAPIFPPAITYAVYGFHFRKIVEKIKGSGMFDGNGALE